MRNKGILHIELKDAPPLPSALGKSGVCKTINNQYLNIAYSLFPKNEMRFKGNIFLSSSDILS